MKNKLLALAVPVILLIGGIMFLSLGGINYSQAKNYPTVDAVVSNIEREVSSTETNEVNETVMVRYTVGGQEYEEVLQFSQTGKYKVGETITVKYNPEKPNYVTSGTSKTSLIYAALGAVFALGGAAMLIKVLRQ